MREWIWYTYILITYTVNTLLATFNMQILRYTYKKVIINNFKI